jgi:hypothetical protein
MPKSRYAGMVVMLCMVILLCTAAGCINFGAMMPGSGQGGTGSGGSGSGAGPAGWTGAGSGSGGGSPAETAGVGTGSGKYPSYMPTAGGGAAASECNPYTPMHTYFTVNCHYHDVVAPENSDNGNEITDITLSGDIPIEMIREWEKYDWDSAQSQGGKLNYQFMKHRICGRNEENCGDCKYTYSGPALGGVIIQRVSPVSKRDWSAHFVLEGPNAYRDRFSLFDPNNYDPYACPPRLGEYSVTGGVGPKIPPLNIQQVLPGCTDDLSQEEMNYLAENEPGFCDPPAENSQFILRDGEVITYKRVDDGGETSGYATVDATYAFHISAR